MALPSRQPSCGRSHALETRLPTCSALPTTETAQLSVHVSIRGDPPRPTPQSLPLPSPTFWEQLLKPFIDLFLTRLVFALQCKKLLLDFFFFLIQYLPQQKVRLFVDLHKGSQTRRLSQTRGLGGLALASPHGTCVPPRMRSQCSCFLSLVLTVLVFKHVPVQGR